jgi:DNA-binding response OmpR family regulator
MAAAVIPFRPEVATRRPRVLAIDDDDGLLDMLVLLLGQSPIELRTAHGGEIGFEMASTWHPDLILLDLNMPDLDGAAFLERYRQSTTPQARIVLVSGALDGLARALELGVSMYLAKPFDLDTLVEMVDEYASDTKRGAVFA